MIVIKKSPIVLILFGVILIFLAIYDVLLPLVDINHLNISLNLATLKQRWLLAVPLFLLATYSQRMKLYQSLILSMVMILSDINLISFVLLVLPVVFQYEERPIYKLGNFLIVSMLLIKGSYSYDQLNIVIGIVSLLLLFLLNRKLFSKDIYLFQSIGYLIIINKIIPEHREVISVIFMLMALIVYSLKSKRDESIVSPTGSFFIVSALYLITNELNLYLIPSVFMSLVLLKSNGKTENEFLGIDSVLVFLFILGLSYVLTNSNWLIFSLGFTYLLLTSNIIIQKIKQNTKNYYFVGTSVVLIIVGLFEYFEGL
jgi:hypothetical protein